MTGQSPPPTLPRVAFVCTHNACRSQIAEALSRHWAAETFVAYSAGTEIANAINPDAVREMKAIYGIDMTATQSPKRIDELPPVDIVVTMGCGVMCPRLPCCHREDWGLADPTGEGEAAMRATIATIEAKVLALKAKIEEGGIPEMRRRE